MRKIPSGTSWTLTITVLILVVIPSGNALQLVSEQSNHHGSPAAISNVVQASSSPGLLLTLNTPSVTLGLGTDAIVGLTISGTNGFNDSVALSSSILPTPPATSADGFSASFSQNVFRISPTSQTVHVNVTIRAYTPLPYLPTYPPLGLYTMNIFALGQTPPLYSASVQMQVTVQLYSPPQPQLLFELSCIGQAYPGSMIQLQGSFTDIGNVQASIAGLDFTGDFGTFNTTSGFPMPIFPAQKKTVNMTITVPAGMSIGTHTISALSAWQYYVPGHYNNTVNSIPLGGWYAGNAIVVSGSISVVAKNSPTPTRTNSTLTTPTGVISTILSLVAASPFALIGVAIYVCLVSLASVLVIRNEHRKTRTVEDSTDFYFKSPKK